MLEVRVLVSSEGYVGEWVAETLAAGGYRFKVADHPAGREYILELDFPPGSAAGVVVVSDRGVLACGLRADAGLRRSSVDQLPRILPFIASGQLCFPRLDGLVEEAVIDEEEAQLWSLVASGASDREIAAVIGYSRSTIQRRLYDLYRLVGANTKRQAAALCARAMPIVE